MTDEERALSIIAEMQDEDGALGFTLSACETAEMADLIAAAIREARVEGARKMLDRWASVIRAPRDGCMCGEKNAAALAALDPEEVVRG